MKAENSGIFAVNTAAATPRASGRIRVNVDSKSLLLVRLDELPTREPHRIPAAARADLAGMVSMGVRDLPPEDVDSQ